MKTIKNVSKLLDVTPATIYNHLNKIESEVKPNLKKIKGVTHINEEGIRQLKISMGIIEVPEVQENISMEVIINDISKAIKSDFKNNFESLESQIETLQEDNQRQIEELRGQNQKLIDLLEEREKKSLIHKLRNIFRKE